MKNKMTVNELLYLCQLEAKHGNGDRTIYISSDDEWNDFHELYYGFTFDENEMKWCLDNYRIEDIEMHHKLKDIILLG